jgi:hypothetical protein
MKKRNEAKRESLHKKIKEGKKQRKNCVKKIIRKNRPRPKPRVEYKDTRSNEWN